MLRLLLIFFVISPVFALWDAELGDLDVVKHRDSFTTGICVDQLGRVLTASDGIHRFDG